MDQSHFHLKNQNSVCGTKCAAMVINSQRDLVATGTYQPYLDEAMISCLGSLEYNIDKPSEEDGSNTNTEILYALASQNSCIRL